jgi:hypothetical protein
VRPNVVPSTPVEGAGQSVVGIVMLKSPQSAWAGAGASAAGVMGTGPSPVDRHGWSSSQLVMRMS